MSKELSTNPKKLSNLPIVRALQQAVSAWRKRGHFRSKKYRTIEMLHYNVRLHNYNLTLELNLGTIKA